MQERQRAFDLCRIWCGTNNHRTFWQSAFVRTNRTRDWQAIAGRFLKARPSHSPLLVRSGQCLWVKRASGANFITSKQSTTSVWRLTALAIIPHWNATVAKEAIIKALGIETCFNTSHPHSRNSPTHKPAQRAFAIHRPQWRVCLSAHSSGPWRTFAVIALGVYT